MAISSITKFVCKKTPKALVIVALFNGAFLRNLFALLLQSEAHCVEGGEAADLGHGDGAFDREPDDAIQDFRIGHVCVRHVLFFRASHPVSSGCVSWWRRKQILEIDGW